VTGWAALRAAAVAVLAGALGAVVWWALAPRPQVVVRGGSAYFVDPDPEQFAAADAWFGVIALVLGILAGVIVWRLGRGAPLSAVLGLASGGLVASLVMRTLGHWLGRVDVAALGRRPEGTVASAPLRLQTSAMLLVLPVAALAAWLVCDLVSDYRSVRSVRLGDGSAAQPATGDADTPTVSPDAPPAQPGPTSG
jgi:hypothetical protein